MASVAARDSMSRVPSADVRCAASRPVSPRVPVWNPGAGADPMCDGGCIAVCARSVSSGSSFPRQYRYMSARRASAMITTAGRVSSSPRMYGAMQAPVLHTAIVGVGAASRSASRTSPSAMNATHPGAPIAPCTVESTRSSAATSRSKVARSWCVDSPSQRRRSFNAWSSSTRHARPAAGSAAEPST